MNSSLENYKTFKSKILSETLTCDKYQFDKCDWVIFVPTEVNDYNKELYIKQHEKYIKRYDKKGRKCVFAYDCSDIKHVDIKFVETIISKNEEFSDEYEHVVCAIFLLTNNTILTNMANMVLKLKSPVMPVFISNDINDMKNDIIKYSSALEFSA